MSHLIPRLVKLHCDQLVVSSSLHIMPSLHHRMMHPAPLLPLDWTFIVSKCLSGKVLCSFLTCSFSIMIYHPFSHTMSYAPILTHHRTNLFPMMMFSPCLCWFIRSYDPLHFLNDLTNNSHPLWCFCSLLLFYLWFAFLWSSVTATIFVLKLYLVVWLEFPSLVTTGFPHPFALIVPKDKSSNILSIVCTLFNLLPL